MTDPFSTQGPPPGESGADHPPAAPPAYPPQAPPSAFPPPDPGPPPGVGPPPGAPADLGATQDFSGLAAPPHSYAPEIPGQRDLAGFGSRLVAWLLDRLILAIIMAVVAIPAVLWVVSGWETELVACADGAGLCEQPTDDAVIRVIAGVGLVSAFSLLVSLVYQWVLLVRSGQTPGRRVMKIRVIKPETNEPPSWGGALIRVIVGGISGQIFYLGHLWMLWDDDNQALHDKAASTIVVQE